MDINQYMTDWSEEQMETFAKEIPTSLGYLRQYKYGNRSPTRIRAKKIAELTQGAVSLADWPVQRDK